MMSYYSAMPFVKKEKNGKKTNINLWAVSGSGDYGVDCSTGAGFAQYFSLFAKNAGIDSGGVLQNIVIGMIKNYGGEIPENDRGLIVGFLSTIEMELVKNAAMIAALERYGVRFVANESCRD